MVRPGAAARAVGATRSKAARASPDEPVLSRETARTRERSWRPAIHHEDRALRGSGCAATLRHESHLSARAVYPSPSDERYDWEAAAPSRHGRIVGMVAGVLAADIPRGGRHRAGSHLLRILVWAVRRLLVGVRRCRASWGDVP